MNPEGITQQSLKLLVQSGYIRSAIAIANGDCWSLVVRFGRSEKTLISKNGHIRVWHKLDTLARYIIKDLGIPRFEIDGSDYDSNDKSLKRPGSASVLKNAHTAAHDKWFREQVWVSLEKADSNNAVWISDENLRQLREKRRSILLQQKN